MVGDLSDPRREEPGFTADERTMLEGWLDFHRVTLLLKVEGLSPSQLLARPIQSSLLSLRGLVRHMADVEAWWFQQRLRGQTSWSQRPWDPEVRDAEFLIESEEGFDDDLALWQREIAASREAASSVDLDRSPAADGPTLRWVLTHMIEEYARHNGHADLLRELVDGAVGC